MKKTLVGFLLMLLALDAAGAHAAPERMQIKPAEKAAKEKTASAVIKHIDLKDIEDPAARKAIQEILNYLNLPSKK